MGRGVCSNGKGTISKESRGMFSQSSIRVAISLFKVMAATETLDLWVECRPVCASRYR